MTSLTNHSIADTEKTLCVGEDYNTTFDPYVYLATYVNDVTGHVDEGDHMTFMVDSLHRIFSKGDIRGRRLLDVGTGPTIHTVISACKHFDEIYLSDVSKPNRDVLQDWRKGTLTHSFSKFFEYIVDKEGKSEQPTAREEETRNKVKDVFFVDLLADSWPELSSKQPYDVIVTSLCLEATAPRVTVYESILKRLVGLLKPGGYIVMIGVLGESFYKVGEKDFFCLRMTESDVKSICTRCSLDIVMWDTNKPSASHEVQSDFEGTFAMITQKVQKS